MILLVFSLIRKILLLPLLFSQHTQIRILTALLCSIIFIACLFSPIAMIGLLILILVRAIYELSILSSNLKSLFCYVTIGTIVLQIYVILAYKSCYLLFSTAYLAMLHDSGGYIIGTTLGKKSLAKDISPKKTAEGFLGSLFFIILGSFLLTSIHLDMFDKIFITYLCLFGDLLFSKLKRIANIKDFSNILPGHGGILDRIDSTILLTWYLFISKML